MHRWAIRRAHIHTHRFDGIGIAEPFEQRDDLVLFASHAHFQYLTSFQIAEDGVIAVSFAARKLINPEKLRSGKRLVFIRAQSFALDHLLSYGLKTLLHKARTDSGGSSHMCDGLGTGKCADRFPQTCGRLPSPATHRIAFCKGFATKEAAKATFQHDQFDPMPSQGQISLLSRSCIMDFYTPFLTMRASSLGRDCHDLHPNCPICQPGLAHNMHLGKV